MALNSPGVEVQVIDESFYVPAAAGTTPIIFAATRSNKANASGTGTALGTLDVNVGKVYTITSQRDLSDTFGVPSFETDANGNPVHAGELNEYGLQAAYSTLGVTSRVYVVRPAIDLAQLSPTTTIPQGLPTAGTYWLDTDNSLYGIGEWDAVNRIFINKTPVIIDDENSAIASTAGVPNSTFGDKLSYAAVLTSTNENKFFYKNADFRWVLVGSNTETNFGSPISSSTFISTSWQSSWPVAKGTVTTPTIGAQFSINNQTVTLGSDVSAAGIARTINLVLPQNGVGAKVVGSTLELYADASASYNTATGVIFVSDITTGTIAKLGLTAGLYGSVALKIQPHTQNPGYTAGGNPTGSVYIKTTTPNNGASWVVKYYNGSVQNWVSSVAPIYADTTAAIRSLDSSGGKNITAGTVIVESNYNHSTGTQATFKLYSRSKTGITSISSTLSTSTISTSSFKIAETVVGSAGFFNTSTISVVAGSVEAIRTAIGSSALTNITTDFNTSSKLFTFSHKLGGEFVLLDGDNIPLATMGFSNTTANLYTNGDYSTNGDFSNLTLRASNWEPLTYTASASSPDVDPADGQLWYTPSVSEVDIMYHNGTTWEGYKNAFPDTDSFGPIISATEPTSQVGGHNGSYALVDGDIWVSTASIELYGQTIYVWSAYLGKWVLQDVSDQTTPDGWLFADARWTTAGTTTVLATIPTMLTSDFIDPDAPDPSLYPAGMRLWNLRRSGNNIKKYVKNYINIESDEGLNLRYNNESMASYVTSRWITASPNNENGSGKFGRYAQRGVVVKAIKSLIDTSQAIRDTDTLVFNLISTPGYPEAIANMIAFNIDRGQTAFVIGDTPFRLKSSGTELAAWATNANFALDNNESGAVSYDEYMGMFYPSGYTTDNLGNNIVVPPSHMMLRTFITSDQKSYQWFAPAGIRRGGVDNVTSVGYVADGEFQPAALPQSIRDVMIQTAKINPIATIPGAGIVNFGNLSRARSASSLDRINVARLVCYLRRQLDILARPFLFEPNDRTTRNEIKGVTESFLLELVGQRALYDFIVVCDESNNTNARIDRSELWMDIAIEPVKSVEFIYIPLRLKNTGTIAGL